MVFVVQVYISYGLICLVSYLYTPKLLLVKGIIPVGYVLKPCKHASVSSEWCQHFHTLNFRVWDITIPNWLKTT